MGGDFAGDPGVKYNDYVLPFQLEASGARGRLVRLGPVLDSILGRHDYPEPVLLLLGEAVTLTAMLGAALKFDGKFILQTQSDGAVGFLVVHYSSPGQIRGYASYDADEVAHLLNGATPKKPLIGNGHLAMTIDPGAGMERYQGIVALTGNTLVDAAHEYFDQSEQIPTFIRIAVARQYTAGEDGGPGRWTWRAGGLMVQKLTREGGYESGRDVGTDEVDDDGWRRAQALATTVQDHELLDPTLGSDRLLYRLFHEEGVRVFDAAPVEARCNCSRERVEAMLEQFSPDQVEAMAEDGTIVVKCEFCNTQYSFDADRYLHPGEPN
ncbi:Hsp33 family molecular chaperone [Rhodomicrobium lacus]|uniref:Hsp33 family molecular chaperone n=1 Tax=Rhodomicrobium lacus TaxID=2498452 RepID=UPI0026E224E4|nr:Hsp33 family molecular chaperone [Rhodomicrobium lacus]WKW50176.1 Hsp33 family molecular chaperone [Rhodomicrobium lacus]